MTVKRRRRRAHFRPFPRAQGIHAELERTALWFAGARTRTVKQLPQRARSCRCQPVTRSRADSERPDRSPAGGTIPMVKPIRRRATPSSPFPPAFITHAGCKPTARSPAGEAASMVKRFPQPVHSYPSPPVTPIPVASKRTARWFAGVTTAMAKRARPVTAIFPCPLATSIPVQSDSITPWCAGEITPPVKGTLRVYQWLLFPPEAGSRAASKPTARASVGVGTTLGNPPRPPALSGPAVAVTDFAPWFAPSTHSLARVRLLCLNRRCVSNSE